MSESSVYRREMAAGDPARPSGLWRAFAGYGLWAVCFTVLYAVHALACTWMFTANLGGQWLSISTITGILFGIWAAFLFCLLVMTGRSGARVRVVRADARPCVLNFMVLLTFIADASAVVVTFISGLPVIFSNTCV